MTSPLTVSVDVGGLSAGRGRVSALWSEPEGAKLTRRSTAGGRRAAGTSAGQCSATAVPVIGTARGFAVLCATARVLVMWGNEHDLEDGKAKDTKVDDFFNTTVVLVPLLAVALSPCRQPPLVPSAR